MNRFTRWNLITGWLVFFLSVIIYLLTLEPTTSFWDCGEFIASSYKLQVGHPPGAPFYLLLAKVFSLFASDAAHVAVWMNALSAISSAFTIMFLYFTITHLSRKIIVKTITDSNAHTILLIIGSGFVGAMAFAFSDTFWFSAVESEVYAQSSLFTAVVFWAILKWEENADAAYADRWIILIFYLMGLSVGVHLLNLLAIPAIAQVYYFRKYRFSVRGFMLSLLISFFVLWFVHFAIVPGSIKIAIWTELLCVNVFGMPFNSGVMIYGVLLLISIIGSIWYTYTFKKILAHTMLLSITVFLIGFSSYTLIIIRANAGTSINENNPKDVFSLLKYLNREQYGDRPLFYGPYYNAPIVGYIDGSPTYGRENGKYVIWNRELEYKYDPRFCTFFPRIYSRNANHKTIYKDWAEIKGQPLVVTKGEQSEIEYKPTFIDNLEFFAKYQLGYMYFRYFLWNFAGKQNDFYGNGGIIKGNFLTGISAIDTYFYGNQAKVPPALKNAESRNMYYCLPLLLGLLGFAFHLMKHKKDCWVVMLLFLMTGLAIVVYLNQTPLQVRERDYAYAGSFYAFAIWIGLGVLAVHALFVRLIRKIYATIISIILTFISVPMLMGFENWKDHDRSGRYIAHDIAFNYLNSCAPNAILFTNGDNDTFPLWYLQEVEGVRTDVRIVNLILLGTDWYIEQMKKGAYDANPLPIRFTFDQIRDGKRDYVYLIEKNHDIIDLDNAVAFVASEDSTTKYDTDSGERYDYFPTHNFMLKVNKDSILQSGIVSQSLADSIESFIKFRIDRGYIGKSELIVMDILANNHWKRPIYFTSLNHNGTLGLDNYMQLEGFAYRFLPVRSSISEKSGRSQMNTQILYTHLMDTFRWGGMDEPGILIDEHVRHTFSLLRIRQLFASLANQLYLEGKRDSAKLVVDRCFKLTEPNNIPNDRYSIELADVCYKIGAADKGDRIIHDYSQLCFEELAFYQSMPLRLLKLVIYEKALAEQRIEQMMEVAETHQRTALAGNLEEALEKYKLK